MKTSMTVEQRKKLHTESSKKNIKKKIYIYI